MTQRLAIYAFLASFMLIFGCPGGPAPQPNVTNQTNQTPQTNYTCPDGSVVSDISLCEQDLCPSSCDDQNICTTDNCSKESGYECTHMLQTPCCGNAACEQGENEDNCIADCGSCPPSCNDGNPCTRDSCSIATVFKCINEPFTGNAIGCSGRPGLSGYSSVELGIALNPPKEWGMDESSLKESGSVLFMGPAGRPNCSQGYYMEGGGYTDIANGLYISLPEGAAPQSTRWQDWDGSALAMPSGSSDWARIYLKSEQSPYSELSNYTIPLTRALMDAEKSGAEVKLLDTQLESIKFSGRAKKFGQMPAYEFIAYGFSNRSGELSNETQRHVYMLVQGRFYTLALAGNGSAYELASKKFDSAILSFRPLQSAGCIKEPYNARITAYSLPATPGYMLGNYLASELSTINASSPYALLDYGDDRLGGNPAKYYEVSLMDGGFPAMRRALISERNGRYYKLEYTALRDEYNSHRSDFDYSAASFQMLGLSEECRKQTCLFGSCIIQSIHDCCGNDACEAGESCSSCPYDCGVCASAYPPLDASMVFLENEPNSHNSYNCEPYTIRVRINNPLDEPLTVYSDDVLKLKTAADSTCRANANSRVDCIATLSGAFGDAYTRDTVERGMTLYAYGGVEPEKGETIYAKTFRFNVTYDLSWLGPMCLHFYCVPGLLKEFKNKNYTLTGIREYRGDILASNWWCHGNRTEKVGWSDIYFNKFYNETCIVSWTSSVEKKSEACYNAQLK